MPASKSKAYSIQLWAPEIDALEGVHASRVSSGLSDLAEDTSGKEDTELIKVTQVDLDYMYRTDPQALLEIISCIAKPLVRLPRRFVRLGLSRMWLQSGQYAFHVGDESSQLLVQISGRTLITAPNPDRKPDEDDVYSILAGD